MSFKVNDLWKIFVTFCIFVFFIDNELMNKKFNLINLKG